MKFYFCLIILLLISIGCEQKSGPDLGAKYQELWGNWNEEFRWSNIYYSYNIGEGESRLGKRKTSSIEFYNDQFRVKILPPERKIISAPDTLYITYSSDTLFTGNYSIKKDSITFFVRGFELPVHFKYSISGDTLNLRALKNESINNDLNSENYFLWGNSINKSSGIFLRGGS